MGLDMYLSRRTYIWSDKRKEPFTLPEGVKPERVKEIVEDFGYWRKANAIHNWIIEHCASEGEDNGADIYLSEDEMKELLDTVNKVLEASKLVKGKIKNGQRSTPNGWEDIMEDGEYVEDPTVAQELLPTTSGFFFGSTEYDQYYIADLKETKKILEQALEEGGDFYYRASW